jgi:hypothetical protein
MTSTRVLVVSLGLLAVSSTASATDVTGPMTFVGITPCRIIETRTGFGYSGVNGPPSLLAGATRTFQITGTVAGLPTQCGIPLTARAISVNFTVTNFAGAGDLRVFPAGVPVPNASILNYELENVANATTMPLGSLLFLGGEIPELFGITVRADGSGTDFIADVNGYYVPRPFTFLESGQTLRGAYAASMVASLEGDALLASFTFPFPLTSTPAANFIPKGGASTANCPGTAANPAALPGELCVYETNAVNSILHCITGSASNSCGFSDTFGAVLDFGPGHPGLMFSFGTWAVTEP